MDRNNMRATYVSSGTRSLPHLGKRHSNGHAHTHAHTHAHANTHANTHTHSARLSPPAPAHNAGQHDDIINYIYDSWNKVSRELERGGGGGGGGGGASTAPRYHQEATPRALAHFRPFNLDEWWGRRLLQALNRKHRS